MNLELEQISALIRNRRTYKPEMMDPEKEVPRQLLGQLFENANWAPSHGHTEPWRFQVYQGAARQDLASKLQTLYKAETLEDKFRQDKFDKFAISANQAPVIIVISMLRQSIEKIPEIEEIQAVACAMQNFHLSASAAGLAGKWSSPPCLYSDRARDAFKLGPKDHCLGLFYLGWPSDPATTPESARGPAENKVLWFA